MTEELLQRLAPRVADALAQRDLPLFLVVALDAQVMADKPSSRGRLPHSSNKADISNVVLLGARAVEYVAAEASMRPKDLLSDLGDRWPHARWLSDLECAINLCLSSPGLYIVDPDEELRRRLIREWYNEDQRKHWTHSIATHREDLLALCRIESDRAWIQQVLMSVSDHDPYMTLIERYREESAVLESRRQRVRNAVTHGNPTSRAMVHSVREYASFLSRSAVAIALESFIENTDLLDDITRRPDDYSAMLSGQDAVSCWTQAQEPH